jgi:hypothetical protein
LFGRHIPDPKGVILVSKDISTARDCQPPVGPQRNHINFIFVAGRRRVAPSCFHIPYT